MGLLGLEEEEERHSIGEEGVPELELHG